ncbi:MAG: hypothetical protein ACI4EK_02730 [Wujia sp.]
MALHKSISNPEKLPGVKKKSFVLPFGGGEIWFEHLDGMYQYTELVLQKLKQDAKIFSLPSKPGLIGFVLDETVIEQSVLEEIVRILCEGKKQYRKIAFIGAEKKVKRYLKHALSGRANCMIEFFEDFEKAKEWLVF